MRQLSGKFSRRPSIADPSNKAFHKVSMGVILGVQGEGYNCCSDKAARFALPRPPVQCVSGCLTM